MREGKAKGGGGRENGTNLKDGLESRVRMVALSTTMTCWAKFEGEENGRAACGVVTGVVRALGTGWMPIRLLCSCSPSHSALPPPLPPLPPSSPQDTGLGGVAFAYLRVGLHCARFRRDAEGARALFRKALDTGSVCLAAEPQSREVSFFCGTPGYLSICCVAAHLLGDATTAVCCPHARFFSARRAVAATCLGGVRD